MPRDKDGLRHVTAECTLTLTCTPLSPSLLLPCILCTPLPLLPNSLGAMTMMQFRRHGNTPVEEQVFITEPVCCLSGAYGGWVGQSEMLSELSSPVLLLRTLPGSSWREEERSKVTQIIDRDLQLPCCSWTALAMSPLFRAPLNVPPPSPGKLAEGRIGRRLTKRTFG